MRPLKDIMPYLKFHAREPCQMYPLTLDPRDPFPYIFKSAREAEASESNLQSFQSLLHLLERWAEASRTMVDTF